VKFLVDHQLPQALAVFLRQMGQHVLDAGLADASDLEICRYATACDRIVISKDEDFVYHASKPDAGIRLLWVWLGNCRTASLLSTFERLWPRVEFSLRAGERIIEIR
jgi:predicted nuclease of predicted toxin-antitoxin system